MKMGDKWTVTRSRLFTVESDARALFVVRLLENPNKPSANNCKLLQNVVSYIASVYQHIRASGSRVKSKKRFWY